MRQTGTDVNSKPGAGIPGWLNECLIDGDPASIRNARRARRKAVSVSLALQVGLLATALIVPLFARVVVPRPERFITPIPPYARGGGSNQPQRAQPERHVRHEQTGNPVPSLLMFQPPRVPTNIPKGGNSASPNQLPPDLGPGEGTSRDGIPGGILTTPFGYRPPIVPAPPEHAPPALKPLPRSEILQQAMLIYRVEPRYPPLALQIRLEGTVRLHAIVGRDGVVRALEILSGHALLSQSALDAVRRWRYRPTILNGEPVEVETYITVIFQLRH
jgi:protein TonB